ncbi:linker for activation of T-cells family member 2 isoform X2 [Talpa occidentalis]|uniref:linker for activation of T-cells family member 2 isoform X2 n=1 Tax=Talpa occidentalis TaxID=50954 RepID=UPI0023F90C01|nr:linker for activation of T-cells family member 2 isoform X2 [Talpa occidentalis]
MAVAGAQSPGSTVGTPWGEWGAAENGGTRGPGVATPGGGSSSLWSAPPCSAPRPVCLSVPLSLGLWEARFWLSTAPCVSRQENQQSFAVAGTYSLVRQAYPGSLMDMVPDAESARKEKLLFSPSLEGSESPREPIAMDYYNWGQCRKALEDDDDTNSYENVLICQQSPDSDEGSDDYQNSSSILQWRKSRKVAEQVRRETCASPESPDEDGEPDYVNGDVSAQKA